MDEVFGDVGVDVDGLGLHVVVGGVDGDELMESEVESGLIVRVFDEADEMDDIGDRWRFFQAVIIQWVLCTRRIVSEHFDRPAYV